MLNADATDVVPRWSVASSIAGVTLCQQLSWSIIKGSIQCFAGRSMTDTTALQLPPTTSTARRKIPTETRSETRGTDGETQRVRVGK